MPGASAFEIAAEFAATFGGPFVSSWFEYLKTSEPSAGSLATETRYCAAPGIADQRSTTGVAGKLSVWPSLGVWSAGCNVQFFVNERGDVQADTDPSGPTERTRHQYVPFGTVFRSVARVLRVRKSSLPCTGEFMPASAAIWNSYLSAPLTGVQAKAGRNWLTAPSAGAVGDGRSSAARAGPAVNMMIAAKAAARILRSAAIQ